MIADWCGFKANEVTYTCAGINHQAFYLDISANGQDLYPILREKLKEPEYYNRQIDITKSLSVIQVILNYPLDNTAFLKNESVTSNIL